MNNKWRYILLWPVSFLYGLITFVRNRFYNVGIFRSTTFPIPIISIGNLAVGGTGKTPHTEYLISLLRDTRQMAVLSRGYKRKTSGFVLADENATSARIGDEPYQLFRKYPEVRVAVDEKRVNGIRKLLNRHPEINLVLLDDAFQHRQIQPGLSILLTDYSKPYHKDSHLPGGNLREWKSGANRADIVIVTKCPTDLHPIDFRLMHAQFKLYDYQSVFFSGFEYQEIVPLFPELVEEPLTLAQLKHLNVGVLLVAGIARPKPLADFLQQYADTFESLFFSDHYNFSAKDLKMMEKKLDNMATEQKLMIVTEKDASRLVNNPEISDKFKTQIYTLPIQVKILNDEEVLFIKKITDYVAENSRNS